MPHQDPTGNGNAVTVHSLWAGSYLPYLTDLPPWPADRSVATWWGQAKECFRTVRGTGFYRQLLPALRDLYDVDFDTISDDGIVELNRRVMEHHADPDWVRHVVVDRANVEMAIVDPFWSWIEVRREDPFTVPLLNVYPLIEGSHPDRAPGPGGSPFHFAKSRGLAIRSFDDYLDLVDTIFSEAVSAGAVGIKSTQAYVRSLRYEKVSRERAELAFGRPPDRCSDAAQKDFEDFMMWRMARLSAQYDLPFQIHTGRGKPDGSNPMLLFNLVAGNPRTKFVLLHGGYPWIGDAAVLAQTHDNVWLDASWLTSLSFSVARRAFAEWIECMPADRILWGGDSVHPEGVYGGAVWTRRALAEALAGKVLRDEMREEQAVEIGRMILRENALSLYSKLPDRLRR